MLVVPLSLVLLYCMQGIPGASSYGPVTDMCQINYGPMQTSSKTSLQEHFSKQCTLSTKDSSIRHCHIPNSIIRLTFLVLGTWSDRINDLIQ